MAISSLRDKTKSAIIRLADRLIFFWVGRSRKEIAKRVLIRFVAALAVLEPITGVSIIGLMVLMVILLLIVVLSLTFKAAPMAVSAAGLYQTLGGKIPAPWDTALRASAPIRVALDGVSVVSLLEGFPDIDALIRNLWKTLSVGISLASYAILFLKKAR